MRIIVLGGDGYLGWPTAMHFAAGDHAVLVVDNYLRRRLARETRSEPLLPTLELGPRCALFASLTGKRIEHRLFDCSDREALAAVFRDFAPDAVIHYAEQPSAPYSMMGHDEALLTLKNNQLTTFNMIWAVKEFAPACNIVKLGTMGEYGTPDIDIEEGYIDIDHKGRKGRFLYPRQGGSFYHMTKIFDTDMLAFHARTDGIAATDLMQGPVYGISTDEADLDPRLMPHFHYDDIFGTVVNRFITQAVAGIPLTVYGKGGQVRGYIDIRDTLQCVELATLNAPQKKELRVYNQITEIFSVVDLAERVKAIGDRMGLGVAIRSVPNPRKESEEHYYKPVHDGLSRLGLKPHYLTDERLAEMIEFILRHRGSIDAEKIMPRISWA